MWASLFPPPANHRRATGASPWRVGAVSLFSIDQLDSKTLERELREKHQVHVKYRKVEHVEGLRVSPHVYMLRADLDTFVTALRNAVEHVDH